MGKTGPIRHRFLYIVLLSVVTSALSLAALIRALSLSEAQRHERARDAVAAELDRLAVAPSHGALPEAAATSFIGLHGGWVSSAAEAGDLTVLAPTWRQPLGRAVARSAADGQRRFDVSALGPAQLIIGVTPAVAGGYAWAGILLQPSAYLRPWRHIAFAVAAATALLVAVSLASAIAFRRHTRALHGTLVALGKDLQTRVPRPGLAELAPIADGIEQMAAALLASREATERLQRELAQSDRLAALGRVAAGVAHEVRNPLAAIKLRLDLAASGTAVPEGVARAVSAASTEITRLDRLVSDLLIVAGKQPGPRRAVGLAELVRARLDTLQPWAAERGVNLAVDGDAVAEADAESLARAVDNLLRNAVEASPPGATVRARLRRGAAQAELVIEDDGAGVDAARVGELFEPFFTTKADGTGLGLALSRAIVRGHGGDLVYTRDGGTTRFVLTLPPGQTREAAA